jgi:hypothetical protein
MEKTMLLAAIFLALAAPGAFAADTADYEVHEWGFVAANAPPDPAALDAFLKNLPGNVRQMTIPAPDGRKTIPSGDATAVRPGTSSPGSPSNPGPTPTTPGLNGQTQRDKRVSGPPLLFNRVDPFLWFHSKTPLSIRLKVNLGINQPLCWWPQGRDDGNAISWRKLDLSGCMPSDKRFEDLGKDSAEFTDLAAKAREVNSSFLGAGNKTDKFVMYDLLGIAWTDLRVRKDAAGILATNAGNWPIREIFVFDDGMPEGKAWYTARLEGREKDRRVDVGSDGYWTLVDFRIRAARSLVEAGLHLDEALCMVKALCGQEAFFKSKGVKAIHLLDSREVENVSRLELQPKPAAVKRAWVMMLKNAS